MKQDKALRKVLGNSGHQLPFGFEARAMRLVMAAAEKKRKQAYAVGLSVTCLLAVVLAAGGYYVVSELFPFKMQLRLPKVELTPSSLNLLFLSFYIGALVLLLLVVDTYVRKRLQKPNGRSGENVI